MSYSGFFFIPCVRTLDRSFQSGDSCYQLWEISLFYVLNNFFASNFSNLHFLNCWLWSARLSLLMIYLYKIFSLLYLSFRIYYSSPNTFTKIWLLVLICLILSFLFSACFSYVLLYPFFFPQGNIFSHIWGYYYYFFEIVFFSLPILYFPRFLLFFHLFCFLFFPRWILSDDLLLSNHILEGDIKNLNGILCTGVMLVSR